MLCHLQSLGPVYRLYLSVGYVLPQEVLQTGHAKQGGDAFRCSVRVPEVRWTHYDGCIPDAVCDAVVSHTRLDE